MRCSDVQMHDGWAEVSWRPCHSVANLMCDSSSSCAYEGYCSTRSTSSTLFLLHLQGRAIILESHIITRTVSVDDRLMTHDAMYL